MKREAVVGFWITSKARHLKEAFLSEPQFCNLQFAMCIFSDWSSIIRRNLSDWPKNVAKQVGKEKSLVGREALVGVYQIYNMGEKLTSCVWNKRDSRFLLLLLVTVDQRQRYALPYCSRGVTI